MDAPESTDLVVREDPLPMTAQQKHEIKTREADNKLEAIRSAQAPVPWYLPTDLDHALRLGEVYYKGGLVPASYKSVQAVVAGMAYAQGLGLDPLVALKNIAVINGIPSLWGNLPLALAMTSRFWGGIDEYFIDEKGQRISLKNGNFRSPVFAAVCQLTHLKYGQRDEVIFSVEDAAAAKLLDKTGPWQQYRKDMLMYKARARALHKTYADVMNGVTIGEDRYDTMDMQEVAGQRNTFEIVKPITGNAADLSSALRGKQPDPVVVVPHEDEKKVAERLKLAAKIVDNWLDQFEKRGGNWDQVKHIFGGEFYHEWIKTATEADFTRVVAQLKAVK